MAYKLTNSMDNVARVDVRVDFRLSLADIAVHYVAHNSFDVVDSETDDVKYDFIKEDAITKAKVMNSVKKSLMTYGDENPYYTVGDSSVLTKAAKFVEEEILPKLFK